MTTRTVKRRPATAWHWSQYGAVVSIRVRSRSSVPLSILSVLLLILTACAVRTPIEASGEPGTPVLEPTPDPLAVRANVSSAAVYEQISQSIVFIESPDKSTGSGIVIDGGWVLTNAHVMDRQPTVRIGRSDGVDLGDHPVAAIDWTLDLALIGPIEDDELVPMPRVESSDLGIGDRVVLVGFPDESSIDPTPTLTEGIISRRRQPILGDFPFLQVDATIAPGQSGGALIDNDGDLIGISGLEFGEGEFGLALEADALWPRIDQMLEQATTEPTEYEPTDNISAQVGQHRTFGLVVETDEVGHFELSAVSDDDLFVELRTLGNLTVSVPADVSDVFELRQEDSVFYYDNFVAGGEEITGDLEAGTYQVVVGGFHELSDVEISSPNVTRLFADVEEGAPLPIGEVVEGTIDWARDSDRWTLDLSADDSVTIVADGILDTLLSVRFAGSTIATSDDEGLGLFGTGSRVEFVAAAAGQYEVEVGSLDTTRWGYLIEVTVN